MAQTETGWTKEFPQVEGLYWARRTQTNRPRPTVIDVWKDGDKWFAYRYGQSREIEAARFTESLYEFLGPISPSDFEQLTRLREVATGALALQDQLAGMLKRWSEELPHMVIASAMGAHADRIAKQSDALRKVLSPQGEALAQRRTGGEL